MKRSTDRILTTHCGSLPRPADLVELLMAKDHGTRRPTCRPSRRACAAPVAECVRLQIERGIDIVNDGEWSKPDYSTYVKDRFTGFEGEPTPQSPSRDMADFPEFAPFRSGAGVRADLAPDVQRADRLEGLRAPSSATSTTSRPRPTAQPRSCS